MRAEPSETLVLDLLEWLGTDGRSYKDAMERWRTSCPRLDIWETAMTRGLVRCAFEDGRGLRVSLTDSGLAMLRHARPGADALVD